MPSSSLIPLTKAAATHITGKNILYMVNDPEGIPSDLRVNLASLLSTMYKIVPSVASNNLTVAVQHLDGSAPSANNPMVFKIGDAFYQTTSTVSFSRSAGTNWTGAGSAETVGQDIDFFMYAIAETGASAGLKFGFSRIPHARTMSDFVNTATSYKYIAGNWVNFNATDKVINIGRFRAQLSAGAAFNWSIPSALVLNFPYFSTDWLYWNPVHTGFSVAPSSGATRYRLDGGLATLAYNPLTTGTSNGTGYTITSPFLAKNIANYFQYSTTAWTRNNGVDEANGVLWLSPGGNTITVRRSTLTTWTASGGKIVTFNYVYEID